MFGGARVFVWRICKAARILQESTLSEACIVCAEITYSSLGTESPSYSRRRSLWRCQVEGPFKGGDYLSCQFPSTVLSPTVWLELAQLDVLRSLKVTEASKNDVYLLPTELF